MLWLAALLGFVVMAGFAAAYDYFPGDLWISHHLQQIHSAAFDDAVSIPEAAADLPYVLAVWLPVLGLLWLLRHRGQAVLLLLAPLGWGVNGVVKQVVDRPRPSSHLVRIVDGASGPSFPSGHTITAVLIFGFLFYLATTLVRRPWLRLLLQMACLFGIIFTGLARIYHGAHWLSDVYGAVLLGILILTLLIVLGRLVISPRKQ